MDNSNRGRNRPTRKGWRVTLAAIIRGVKPKNAAKWLECELDCSPRQAWRAVQEGRVSSALRRRLLAALDEAITANEQELRRLRRELRDLEDGRSSRSIAPDYPLARVVAPDAEALPGLDRRADEP